MNTLIEITNSNLKSKNMKLVINSLLIAVFIIGMNDLELNAQSRENNNTNVQHNEPKKSTRKSRRINNTERSNQTVEPGRQVETPSRNTATPSRSESQPATTPGRSVPAQAQTSAAQNQAAQEIIRQLEEQSKPVVQNVTNGEINWTRQYVEATGQAIIDNERFKNPAQARLMAQRGAVVVAQRNLLEIIKGVHVTGETSVEDMATSYDYIYTRVDGLIKGAEQIGQPVEKDGFVEVRMRVPLEGTKGLAGAVADAARQMNSANARVSAPELAGNVANAIDGSKPLVFNLAGQKISPSMFPMILDEAGNMGLDLSRIYDAANGNLPKYIQAGEDIIKKVTEGNVADVIDLVVGRNGMLQVAPTNKRKINWGKIASVAATVGKFIMTL
jgi:hypothetical protein